MKCQNCGKNYANISYMQIINGDKQEVHLCSECAENINFIDISSIFSSQLNLVPKYMYKKNEVLKCKKCGYSIEDYSKTGLFGCSECYTTFKDNLDDIFLKLHGKNKHYKLSVKENYMGELNIEVSKLKDKLKKLIAEEKYEDAAIIRDKIREIEGK